MSNELEKLKLHSPDWANENIRKLAEIFPNCVTETKADDGTIKHAIDYDQLRQELSDHIVDGPQERYHLNWPGKRKALLAANAPIAKTLRPARDESVDFDTTQNLFIEGDNLEALKLLQETYLGKVKMIYIDPPYNTGNDFIYEDDFAESAEAFLERSNQKDEEGNRLVANPDSKGRFHSDWLSMMYSRLRLAKNLLLDEGVIAIHIDENEASNLDKILSEIFGEENNLGTIVWDKRNPKGDSKGIAQQHELVSFYCKNIAAFKQKNDLKRPKENAQAILKKANLILKKNEKVTADARKEFKDWLSKQPFSGGEKAYANIDDSGNVFQPVSMAWPNKKKAPDEYFEPLIHPITGKPCPVPDKGWRNPKNTMKELIAKDLIVFGSDETTQPRRKYLLVDNLYENVPSLLYHGGSDDALLKALDIVFDTPKVTEVSKKLIQPILKRGDIIIDFFAGSATTAHAVMQLNAEDGGNRKFIMVQLPEECDPKSEAAKAGYSNIAEISKERIRRAGAKILDGECHADWNKDIGFRVLKVDTSNMKDVYYRPDEVVQSDLLSSVDNIKEGRTGEDLLFQVLVDWGVDLTLPIRHEKIDGKSVYFVDDDALIACFETGINEEFVKQLATHKPLRVVFRDNGFASDDVKANVAQIFRQTSPDTDIKVI